MAQPSPYNRAFNFSNYQAANPTAPPPGGRLDEEFSRVKAVIDEIRAVIALIQRDDGELANQSVGTDQLKTEILSGVNPAEKWTTLTAYVAGDAVFNGAILYRCISEHTSGTFATDLAAGRWTELADFTASPDASTIAYDNSTSGLTAEDVQAAIDEVKASISASGVASVFGRSGAVVAAIGDYASSQVTYTSTGRNYTTANNAQTAISDMDTAIKALSDNTTSALTGKADSSHSHTISAVTGLQTALDGKAAATHGHSIVESGCWNFLLPSDGDYTLILEAAYALTITSTISQCASGSCTATFKIGTTALGGGANAVSTTKQTKTHASARTMTAGDKLVVTISANSSCVKAALQVNFTRTI